MNEQLRGEPTVFVVEDDPQVGKQLLSLFKSANLRVEVFLNALDYLTVHDASKPGCLVVDVRLPRMSGLELLEKLSTDEKRMPAIVLTGYADVRTAVRAMKAGAMDVIEKPFHDQTLLELIWKAIELDGQQRQEWYRRFDLKQRFEQLTPRERQVIDLIVEGYLTREIAEKLELSPKTIENYRANVLEKMQAKGLADLMRIVMSLGVYG